MCIRDSYKGVPYDGNDPAYQDFYHAKPSEAELQNWYTSNEKFREYWFAVMKELIDLYQPDLLYSDGGLPFSAIHEAAPSDPNYRLGLEAVSYLYNTSIKKHGEKDVYKRQGFLCFVPIAAAFYTQSVIVPCFPL